MLNVWYVSLLDFKVINLTSILLKTPIANPAIADRMNTTEAYEYQQARVRAAVERNESQHPYMNVYLFPWEDESVRSTIECSDFHCAARLSINGEGLYYSDFQRSIFGRKDFKDMCWDLGQGEFIFRLIHARDSTSDVEFSALLEAFGETNFYALMLLVLDSKYNKVFDIRTKKYQHTYSVDGPTTQWWNVNYGKLQAHLGYEGFNMLLNNLRFCDRCRPFFDGLYYYSIYPTDVTVTYSFITVDLNLLL